jgi:hypothetical protein
MEVHHHPKVEKKNFKEYFLEFVMIFLAVTLGFFAEALREHISNNEMREQYVRSLTEDLESDTERISSVIEFDDEKIAALNSMYQCYDTVSNDLKATSCMGELIKFSKVNRSFIMSDRTLTQLANAGGFRFLKKKDADSILTYQRWNRQYNNFESTIYQGAQDNVRNTLNELADFKVLAPLESVSPVAGTDTTRSGLNGPILFSNDKALLNKWFNQLQLYLRVIKAQKTLLENLQKRAINLTNFYKKEHGLE